MTLLLSTQEQIEVRDHVQPLLDYFTDSLQSAKTIEEQALILNIIDQLAHALELNAKGEINKFNLEERAGAFAQSAIAQFLKGINHNKNHPIEYFIAPVVATAELARYCVEMAALGEYVVNFGEQGLSAEQLEQLNSVGNAFSSLQETIPNLTAEQWGAITGQVFADVAFGMGLSKTTKILRNLAKAAEINRKLKLLADATLKRVGQVIFPQERKTAKLWDELNKLENAVNGIEVAIEAESPRFKEILNTIAECPKEFGNKSIKMKFKHPLTMDLKITKKGVRLSGFHHDYMGAIEKGFPIITDKVMGKHGIYKANVWLNGISKEKTFFPQNWSREKVISKIAEAINGAKCELQPNGVYKLTGSTREGIKIEMHMTKSGLITSAYPADFTTVTFFWF